MPPHRSMPPRWAWRVPVPLLSDAGGGRLYVALRRPTWHTPVLFAGFVCLAREGVDRLGLRAETPAVLTAYLMALVAAFACGQALAHWAPGDLGCRVVAGLLAMVGVLLTDAASGLPLAASAVTLGVVLGTACAGEVGYRLHRTDDVRADDVRAGDVRTDDVRTGDVRAEDLRTDEGTGTRGHGGG